MLRLTLRRAAPSAASSSRLLGNLSAHLPNPAARPLLDPQRRTLFIQTASTPNPQSLKFLPGRLVYETEDERGFSSTPSDPPHSPLSQRLFKSSPSITSCYLGIDFVTVNIDTSTSWETIKPTIFSAIMDHYASGDAAVLSSSEVKSDTEILDDDSEVVAMIKELLEVRIRPAVQEDGGDIKYVNFADETGIVQVRLEGSCVGCPSSSVTLKSGVENMLMHYIPEVKGVEAVDEEGSNQLQNMPEDVKTEEWNPEEDDGKPKMTYEERLKAAGIPFSE
mmetsp:Transcript_11640/g.21186  ORF Transcript_11640/g.21186 Transcript_11640/m.21186 type:complete len:278 (-) Transcript_11640:73-906(-)|eukprot:CAMPEP_0182497190 /NCGR_PEP_ID=MMETSP1321-20130603/5727_1 /TAXON_ID=91990 /ORGANISM="Bolidomonas sp., Strain RCC1657" /LENGTH=277 /DNA_ID=CAMNT_0024701005 /DNA_START=94 /DNA_END=927 /DNA_ORIENTATION=+